MKFTRALDYGIAWLIILSVIYANNDTSPWIATIIALGIMFFLGYLVYRVHKSEDRISQDDDDLFI